MAQQPVDQKTMFRMILIWTALWIVMMLGIQRFMGPKPSGQDAKTLLTQAWDFRKQKKPDDAVAKCDEVMRHFGGTESAAQAILLKAEIQGIDLKQPLQAFQLLRQDMERYYSNTQTYRQRVPPFERSGRERQAEFGVLVDKQNRQFTNYKIIDAIVGFFGRGEWSYVWAILVIAVAVRVLQIPIANKQFASMRKMQQIQPLVKELQEKYKGQELAQKQMELFKKYNVNPMGGCLYALIPLPFLIWVYNMIQLYIVKFQDGHFLWINPDFGHHYPGLIGANLGQFDAPLLILYALSMFVTSRMSAMDPSQAQQAKTMAIVTTGIFVVFSWQWGFPSAFMLYWLITNILYTVHYKLMIHGQPVPLIIAPESSNGNGLSSVPVDEQQPSKNRVVYQPPKRKKKRR